MSLTEKAVRQVDVIHQLTQMDVTVGISRLRESPQSMKKD